MRRWLTLAIPFAIGALGFAAAWVYVDHRHTIADREEALLAQSRVIAAHASAALGDAEKIVLATEDEVAAWDQRDADVGQSIHERLKKMLSGSPHIASAWVLNQDAVNIVDSWSYPARPVTGAERIYFLRHKQGPQGPLVVADPQPGAITGRHRFTYSVAQRHPDGTLKSIIVVGIYSDHFAKLYAEVTKWQGGRAGFYDGSGAVLAQHGNASHFAIPNLAHLNGSRDRLTSIVQSDDGRRLMAQTRLQEYPNLIASASQPLSGVLAEWRMRTGLVISAALLASLGFCWFAWSSGRMERMREEATMKDLAMREAHHRIKNGLQLMVSMIQMRERLQNNPASKELMRDVAQQVRAVAEVHDLLQSATRMDNVDLNVLLESLCRSLRTNWHGQLHCELGDNLQLPSDKGSVLAIVINELLTNALKHAATSATLKSEIRLQTLLVTVSNDGPPLPPDFKLYNATRFGLKTAVTLCSQIGASLQPMDGVSNGAAFRVALPLEKEPMALAS